MSMRSSLAEVTLPKELLYGDYIIQQAQRYGDRTAMVDVTSERRYSYTELADSIRAFASAMLSRGMRRGDVMLVHTPNCIEYPVVLFGVIYMGGVVTTANYMYTAGELRTQIQDSNAKFICTTPEGEKTIKAALDNVEIKDIILIGDSNEGHKSVAELIEIGKRIGPPDVADLAGRSQDDAVVICYSSGTTGLPKGTLVSHRTFLYFIYQIRDPSVTHLEAGNDVTLATLPFFHLWGLLTSLGCCLAEGATNVVFARFHPDTYINAIEKYKATVLYVVPPVLMQLIRNPGTASTDLSSLKHIISSAAPLATEVVTALQLILPPGTDLKQGFGMSEAGLVFFGKNNSKKPTASGILMSNAEAKVVDIETRDILGPNKRGEILVKSPSFMLGYLNKPQATHDLYNEDNWLKTGDIGYYDEEGYWFVVDRLKEIINYKGYNICPAEIENALLELPGVEDVAVVGVPDKEAIELPGAYVVRAEGSHLSEQDIHQFMDEKLTKIKRLKGGVRFVEKIPRSPAGKMLRRLLREQIRQEQREGLNKYNGYETGSPDGVSATGRCVNGPPVSG